jgi:hypothetical protein
LRGADKYLSSNQTAAEGTDATFLASFNPNGFSMGTANYASGRTVVGWQWKANGSGSTNTSGSITSTVSASTTSGFSIVTYTGTGANATVGHGLGVAPKMVIVKGRNTVSNWVVWQSTFSGDGYILLNSTGGQSTGATIWNSTVPTSTVFSVGTNASVNESADPKVAYCFAEISGYSKAFSYTGNGSADGPFVFTGFRPAYVMIKCTNGTYNWIVFDNKRSGFNVNNDQLYPNTSGAEDAGGSGAQFIDLLSNGFKLRNTAADKNAIGGTYIGMAFAEAPQKFSLAR